MKWLLDTHIILFAMSNSKKLGAAARKILLNPENQLRFSAASLWEISLKSGMGKLDVEIEVVEEYCREYDIGILPVLPQHIRDLNKVSTVHPDPFDRLLIAQAESTPMYLLTQDEAILNICNMAKAG